MDQIAQSIIAEIAACCGLNSDSVTTDAWLVEYGSDSVNSLELLMGLEDRYDISLSDEEIAEIVTVSDVISIIQTKVSEAIPHET